MKKFKILIVVNLLVLAVLAFSLLKTKTVNNDETPWTASSVSKDPIVTAQSRGISQYP